MDTRSGVISVGNFEGEVDHSENLRFEVNE